jgi:hypothetical protein
MLSDEYFSNEVGWKLLLPESDSAIFTYKNL